MKFPVGSKVVYTPVNARKGLKAEPCVVEILSYAASTQSYVVYMKKPGYRQKKLIAEHLLSDK